MSDRTVHGLTDRGAEIVRYDRAGRWYVEWRGVRSPIDVRQAARLARKGEAYLGRPGGGRFDKLVRR